MTVEVDLTENTLKISDKKFFISCIVRNELNGWRKPNQVVRSIPHNNPVYPRQFPKGTWNIYGVQYTDDAEYAPVKIKTNAFQMLPIWDLDDKGNYKSKTTEYIRDEAYWLHYSEGSSTTLGCIRLNSAHDAIQIAEIIEKQLEIVECIKLEVV
jgi:hypothetical protein